MTPHIPDHRLQKEKQRFLEDAEFELKLENITLQIADADPISKTLTCTGSYTDFLLAKKVATKKGWTLEKQE